MQSGVVAVTVAGSQRLRETEEGKERNWREVDTERW